MRADTVDIKEINSLGITAVKFGAVWHLTAPGVHLVVADLDRVTRKDLFPVHSSASKRKKLLKGTGGGSNYTTCRP